MALTATQIEMAAQRKGLRFKNVSTPEGEFLVVTLSFGVSAFFKMSENELNYNYSHTYNFSTDKTTKRIPSIFK